jgi:hypothetical protein
MLVSFHITTQCHNPEDHDLNVPMTSLSPVITALKWNVCYYGLR